MDSGERSWHWVRLATADEIETELGHAGGEQRTDAEPKPKGAGRKSAQLVTKDAIEYCKVSRSQFYEWVRRGYVKRVKIGRYVRYSIKALDEMLGRFEQQAARSPRHKRRMRRFDGSRATEIATG